MRAIIATKYEKNANFDDLIEIIKLRRVRLGLDPDDDPAINLVKILNEEGFSYVGHKLEKVIQSQNNEKMQDQKLIKKLEQEAAMWKEKAMMNEDYQTLKRERDELLANNKDLRMKNKNQIAMINEEKAKNRELMKQI